MTRLKFFLKSLNFEGIDPKRGYVMTKSYFPKIVFLCGGTDIKSTICKKGVKYFRPQIHEELKKDKYNCAIVRAEQSIDSYEKQTFDIDLLQLETYFAALVSIIPIVCESPGSIAELGAFVGNVHIRKKIFIIIQKKYYSGKENDSFIYRGLIKNYEKNVPKDKSRICEIDDKNPKKDLERVAESIIKQKFDQTRCDFRIEYFQILLLADIINVLVRCNKEKITEHFKYAMKCAFPKSKDDSDAAYKNFEERLDEMLFILKELDIIEHHDEVQYKSMNPNLWFLDYRSKDPKKYKKINEVRNETLNGIIKKNKEQDALNGQ